LRCLFESQKRCDAYQNRVELFASTFFCESLKTNMTSKFTSKPNHSMSNITKIRIAISACVAIVLFGCASPTKQKISLQSTFNKEQAQKLMAAGPNTIKGSALMRQVGGAVVTCAGQAIGLYPVTEYSTERVKHIYGNDNIGMISAFVAQHNLNPFENTDEDYRTLSKSTQCDAQGFFKFEKIADGEFYLTSSIMWKSNPSSMYYEGGIMMRKVKVQGGEIKELVMAP